MNPSSPATAPPLEDDDLLTEILLRLSSEPSSLPRVSLVCKRWHNLVSDSDSFLRRFRDRHRIRGPPVLGVLTKGIRSICFTPTLDPPNRVPPGRFYLRVDNVDECIFAGCRQGLVLILNITWPRVLVWDPVTGYRRRIAIPAGLKNMDLFYSGSLLPAVNPADEFQVVLVRTDREHARAAAHVYSSETGLWGDPVSVSSPLLRKLNICIGIAGALVGGRLYWSFSGKKSAAILEFDLHRPRSLAVIPVPLDMLPDHDTGCFRVMPAEGAELGLLSLSAWEAKLWKRKTDHGGAAWVLDKTVQLDKLFSISTPDKSMSMTTVGSTEDSKTLFLWSYSGFFMVQIEPVQFKKLSAYLTRPSIWVLPFSSVYTGRSTNIV